MIKLKPEEGIPSSRLPHLVQENKEIVEITEDLVKIKIRISNCQRRERRFRADMTKQKDFLQMIEEEINDLDDFIKNV